VRRFYPLISIIFIFCMSGFGLSYAAWNDGLIMESTVSTGHINTVFVDNPRLWKDGTRGDSTREKVRGESLDIGSAALVDGKHLQVTLQEAGRYYLNFKVRNDGALPVELVFPKKEKGSGDGIDGKNLKVKFKRGKSPGKSILNVGETMEGCLELKVKPPNRKKDYQDSFTIVLQARQARLI
jgi:hypothetical protein